jgi:hypothetical protein
MNQTLQALLGAATLFVLGYIFIVTRKEWRYDRLAAYMKNKEAYRGSQAIGGRTDGPAASSLTGADVEGFTDVVGKSEVAPDSGPAPAALNPRTPYHLLQGVLKDAPVDNQDNTKLNSCACYGIDYENRIQRTGNFVQRTNNYKRANPDSCSAPFHELVNNFYEKMTLVV